jgi:hypothetical protein
MALARPMVRQGSALRPAAARLVGVRQIPQTSSAAPLPAVVVEPAALLVLVRQETHLQVGKYTD